MTKDGFGKPAATQIVAKPLKRPRQARAVFTVEAIFEALVRIWQRQGWSAVTTRSVALEAGVAVGTLYDYFPSKHALISGLVRFHIEKLLQRIDKEVIALECDWQTRIRTLITICCAGTHPLYSLEMWQLEPEIAEPKHQKRAFEELAGRWHLALKACTDLPCEPSYELAESLFLMAWGGRRYAVLGQLSQARQDSWITHMEQAFTAVIKCRQSGCD